MKRQIFILTVALAGILLLGGCGRKNYNKTDLTSTHTTASKETMSPIQENTVTQKESTSAASHSAKDETKKESGTAANVSTVIHTYSADKITIEYPEISGLSSSSTQKSVNQLLKDHAMELIDAMDINKQKDSLVVKCNVISADRRRISAVYTGIYTPDGAAYPTNLFYTNTIDTVHGRDLSITDYADPYTLAGYIRSDDCRFYNSTPELEKVLMEIKNDVDLDEYTAMFQHADFPYKEKASDTKDSLKFPESFSYEDQGTIIVSIPVPHALGDYALIKYTPDTK